MTGADKTKQMFIPSTAPVRGSYLLCCHSCGGAKGWQSDESAQTEKGYYYFIYAEQRAFSSQKSAGGVYAMGGTGAEVKADESCKLKDVSQGARTLGNR